jgi:hypothetical protein
MVDAAFFGALASMALLSAAIKALIWSYKRPRIKPKTVKQLVKDIEQYLAESRN